MKNRFLFIVSVLFFATIIQGCKREHLVDQRAASTAHESGLITAASNHGAGEWNVPVHLGSEVNSPFRELGASLSPDGLSLYFNSDRPAPPGLGFVDIYVSHRACIDCPWEQAQNLGAPINGPGDDGTPALSHDGHLLFFSSDRGDGLGGLDLWVSHRQNPNDDFGWEEPVNLGPLVNSAGHEGSPSFVGGGEHGELYFGRSGSMIWVAPVSQHGVVLGPAVEIDLGGDANGASVTKDGREMVFWANRTGRPGGAEIYVSTRNHMGDPWSTPVNVGAPVNSNFADLEAGISDDGNTLVFSVAANRVPSLGLNDIWISTRVRH